MWSEPLGLTEAASLTRIRGSAFWNFVNVLDSVHMVLGKAHSLFALISRGSASLTPPK